MHLRMKFREMFPDGRPHSELTFQGAWEALPPPQREVIDMIVRHGLSLSQCATRLGLDVEDVRRLTVHGMRTLRSANAIDRPTSPGPERPPTADSAAVRRPGLRPTTDGVMTPVTPSV